MDNEKKYRKFDGFTTNAWRRPENSPGGEYVTPEELEQGLATKQNKLTAGANITIDNDVISSSGDNLFMITPDATPYQDVEDAYLSGKILVLNKVPANPNNKELFAGYKVTQTAKAYRFEFTRTTRLGQVHVDELLGDTGEWTHTVLALANTNSPTLSGTPTAPTAAVGTSSAQIATTKFVQNAIAGTAPVQTQGNWAYKIFPDNTFEAWFSQTGLSYAITAESGGWYRSEPMSLAAPQALYDAYDLDITFANVQVGHANYPTMCSSPTFYATGVNYYVLSGSSRQATPNYTLSCYMRGTLTPKS